MVVRSKAINPASVTWSIRALALTAASAAHWTGVVTCFFDFGQEHGNGNLLEAARPQARQKNRTENGPKRETAAAAE
jgi:hypothetical protein